MKKLNQENIELGLRLKNFRLAKRLSIDEVARQIGVASSTYRDWEAGRAITGNPYSLISAALGVGIYQILGVRDEIKDDISNTISRIEELLRQIKLTL